MASPCSPSEDDNTHLNTSLSVAQASAFKQQNNGKTCKICGDRAVGYNFSVISCESCKAFFRRNANREKELSCPFTNSCEINTISRRFCQSCRLKKCFEVGMKKEWIMMERNRRTKKRRLTTIPNTADDINRMFEEIGEGDVTVTKSVLLDLVKNRPSSCQCKCTCGFYPPDTALTALIIPPNEQSPQSGDINFGGVVSNSQTNQPIGCTERITGWNEVEKTSDGKGCEWPWQVAATRTQCIDVPQRVEWNAVRVPNVVSPSANGAFSPTITHIPSQSPFVNAGNPSQSSAFMNTLNATTYPEYETPSCSGDTSMCVSNRILQASGSVAVPALQPRDVLVTLDEYSRIIDSTNRAAETHSSILMLPAGLSERDRFLMQELIIANGILKQPVDMSLKQRATGDLSLMDVVRMADLALRRIIDMAKEISSFRELSQDDQIALLKGSSSELLILRGVMVFDPTKHVWNHHVIQGSSGVEIKLDVLKGSKESQHYEDHKRFLTTFSEKWRRNENVMLLLNAITLFSPDRSNLKNTEIIRAKQLEYYQLLRTYLNFLCSPMEAHQAYDMLLGKLVDLRQLNQGLLRIYYGLNIKEVDPLLLELFDLAQHRQ
uniref:Nuclear receptor domain-containing protein n=1 Tax=Ascaris lumbricoides TaxID=6252 RepID=A0A9J2P6J8_ASCLU